MRQIAYIFLVLMVTSTISCKDIIEEDLSDDTVQLIAPSDGVVTDVAVQTFWWDELDGALSYDLQVVRPRFDSITQLVLDTTLTETQFSHTLFAGQFQWRVRAVNGSSETSFTTYSLTVDTTSDLSGQTILLSAPSEGSYSNALTNQLSWQGLTGTFDYRIQVSLDGFQTTYLDTLVSSSSASVSLNEEGEVSWKVRAESSTSVSQYSQVSTFTVDTSAPAAPTLWLPVNNSFITTQPFDLVWQQASDSGSPLSDSLVIYSDSLITVFDTFSLNTETHQDSLPAGQYFWRVLSKDDAGNIGPFSDSRKFTVQ